MLIFQIETKMEMKKNIKAGKNKLNLVYFIFLIFFFNFTYSFSEDDLKGKNTSIKI